MFENFQKMRTNYSKANIGSSLLQSDEQENLVPNMKNIKIANNAAAVKLMNKNKELLKRGKELLPPAKRGSLGNTIMTTTMTTSFNNTNQNIGSAESNQRSDSGA